MAMNGDIVHVRYVCKDEQGNVVDDSAHSEEPVCFEVSRCREACLASQDRPAVSSKRTGGTSMIVAAVRACCHGY